MQIEKSKIRNLKSKIKEIAEYGLRTKIEKI